MTPRDLMERLQNEGLNVSLKLRLEGDLEPSPKTVELLKQHRNDLVIYLSESYGTTPPMCRLSEQLTSGAVWCSRCYRYQVRPCQPSDKALN